MGCGGLVPGKSEQFGTIGTVFGSGPEWQTVHGGVTTAGGAVGAGPSIVVEGAPQLEAIVAGPGPTWIGLHAGNLSRSSEKCRSATLNFYTTELTLTLIFDDLGYFCSLPTAVHGIYVLYSESWTVPWNAVL